MLATPPPAGGLPGVPAAPQAVQQLSAHGQILLGREQARHGGIFIGKDEKQQVSERRYRKADKNNHAAVLGHHNQKIQKMDFVWLIYLIILGFHRLINASGKSLIYINMYTN